MNLLLQPDSKGVMQRWATRPGAVLRRVLALMLVLAAFALLTPALPAIAAPDEQAVQLTACSLQSVGCVGVCQPAPPAGADTAQAPFSAPHAAAESVGSSLAPESGAAVARATLAGSGPPLFLRFKRLLL